MENQNELVKPPRMKIESAFRTHIGRVRAENQDNGCIDEQLGLHLVSDGMGGHAGGAFASKLIVEVLPEILKRKEEKRRPRSRRSVKRMLAKVIHEMNQYMINDGSKLIGLTNMGATIVLAVIRNGVAYIANVGDSRGYLYRKDKLIQKSEEHSLIHEMINRGEIEQHEREGHPARGVVTRYIGIDDKAIAYVHSFKVKDGDRILLCSDGLTDMVPDTRIAEILSARQDPDFTCLTLIASANGAGGVDNISALVVDVKKTEKNSI